MIKYRTSPKEMFATLWRNRELIVALTKREIVGRYKGSLLGLLWSFLTPILMLTVYTFVFSVVFKARWSGGGESKAEFALILFAGLLIFNIFSETVNRAPLLIVSNANYVKKIVFPIEIMSWVVLGAALFHFVVSLLVWLIFYTLFFGVPKLTLFMLPAIMIPLLLFCTGISWWLASLGVFFRDVGQFTSVLVTALMFLSPIFYPAAALPEPFSTLIYLNPLSIAIEQTREVLFFGVAPSLTQWLGFCAVGFGAAWMGFTWFQKTRKGFADVI